MSIKVWGGPSQLARTRDVCMRLRQNYTKNTFIFKKNKGFSLVEAMVTIAIMGVVAVGSMSMMNYLNKERKRNSVMLSVQIIRQKLLYNLSDNSSWNQTRNHANNTGFIDCGNACVDGSETDLEVYDQAAVLLHNPKVNGFKADGSSCALADTTCILKVDVKLKLKCTDGTDPCSGPDMIVKTLFALNPTASIEGLVLNGANYNFEVYKGSTVSSGPGYDGKNKFILTPKGLFNEVQGRNLYAVVTRELYDKVEANCQGNQNDYYDCTGALAAKKTPLKLRVLANGDLKDTDKNITLCNISSGTCTQNDNFISFKGSCAGPRYSLTYLQFKLTQEGLQVRFQHWIVEVDPPAVPGGPGICRHSQKTYTDVYIWEED